MNKLHLPPAPPPLKCCRRVTWPLFPPGGGGSALRFFQPRRPTDSLRLTRLIFRRDSFPSRAVTGLRVCPPLPPPVCVSAWRRSKVAPGAGVNGGAQLVSGTSEKKSLGQLAGSGLDWPVEVRDPSRGDDPRRPQLADTQGFTRVNL